jgi:hypothetical protein
VDMFSSQGVVGRIAFIRHKSSICRQCQFTLSDEQRRQYMKIVMPLRFTCVAQSEYVAAKWPGLVSDLSSSALVKSKLS